MTAAAEAPDLVRLEAVSKRFGTAPPALDAVSGHIRGGEIGATEGRPFSRRASSSRSCCVSAICSKAMRSRSAAFHSASACRTSTSSADVILSRSAGIISPQMAFATGSAVSPAFNAAREPRVFPARSR